MTSLPPIWAELSGALAADRQVGGVWLGGSYARGEADAYSDIDLAIVASSEWKPDVLSSLWLAYQTHRLGGSAFFHGILRDGTILDVLLVDAPPPGYVPVEPASPQPASPGQPEPLGIATDFWINSHKHRKVMARGLEAMAIFGLHHERVILLRLWAVADSGIDPGPGAGTIHGMTPLIRRHVTQPRREILGLPARNVEEVRLSIQAHRQEVSKMGRQLEQQYGISYPHRLEALVNQSPLP